MHKRDRSDMALSETSLSVGDEYSFKPLLDVTGNTYSITNQPSWATFDTSTGELSGSITSGSIGQYNDIIISVTNENNETLTLTQFNISANDFDADFVMTINNDIGNENDKRRFATEISHTYLFDVDWGDGSDIERLVDQIIIKQRHIIPMLITERIPFA